MISEKPDKSGPGKPHEAGAAPKPSNQKPKRKNPRRQKKDAPPLIVSLMVAVAIMSVIAFVAGALYGFWLWKNSVQSLAVPHLKSGLSPLNILPFGFSAAVQAFPATVLLTFGGGIPLFRRWIARGYIRATAYVAGGIILALLGAAVLTLAHVLIDYLSSEAFWVSLMALALYGPIAGTVVWGVLRRSLIELAAESASQQMPPAPRR